MVSHAARTPLTAEERIQRRRLMLSDTVSLASLFVITAVLAVLTNAFHQSYARHQAVLARRWQERGELDLKRGDPVAAINALRSALIYAPDQRNIEIELASALASAGRIQEATSYFNTLAESEPGSGIINLQLARLAARQDNTAQAIEDYHRAIYGTWEGDGYIRRREVRMELINFLISRQLYTDARSELLVAVGNSPETDTEFLLQAADAMERAFDPADALRVYKTILQHQPESLAALQGAGRTAFELGHYVEAKEYLEKAINSPSARRAPAAVLRPIRDQLHDTIRLLLLYPSPQLGLGAQTERILLDREIAHTRLQTCLAAVAPGQTPRAPAAETAPSQSSPSTSSKSPASSTSGSSSILGTAGLRGSLESLASRFGKSSQKAPTGAPQSSQPIDALNALSARWAEQPATMTASTLEANPELAQSTIQLIYDTEKVTAQVCGPPTGDDALLLKIAQAPNAVGQE